MKTTDLIEALTIFLKYGYETVEGQTSPFEYEFCIENDVAISEEDLQRLKELGFVKDPSFDRYNIQLFVNDIRDYEAFAKIDWAKEREDRWKRNRGL